MSDPAVGPAYYSPKYGLPEYDAGTDTDRTDTTDTRTAEREPWRAPGVGAGRLQWEPLSRRDTLYPWEYERPPEAWERSTRTVDEGPLPARPEPVAPLKPADPLPPVDLGQQTAPPKSDVEAFPSRAWPPPELTKKQYGKSRTAGKQSAGSQPAGSQPAPRVQAQPSGRETAPASASRYLRPAQTQLQAFPPPTGQPVTPKGQRLHPRPTPPVAKKQKRKGGLPWFALLMIVPVLFDPNLMFLPLLAGLFLIGSAKYYRTPAARVGWGGFVIILGLIAVAIHGVLVF
ncbi:hypothetical protein [Enemella sp. A6]|uniref:hypothetical protein n=1 Tax=Enemella sp. A6 TaxID=3440152 RepID=UPI003EB85397